MTDQAGPPSAAGRLAAPIYISTGRAAQLLGCSDQTVRNLVDEGRLRATRLRPGRGGWLRIELESVREHLARMLQRE